MKSKLSCRREAQNDTFEFCRKSSFFESWHHEMALSCRRDAHFRVVDKLRKWLIFLCQFYENAIFPLFFDGFLCQEAPKVPLGWVPQGSGVSWEGPARVSGVLGGSLEGPAVFLEGYWKDPRRCPARVLGASWQCPARSETNSDNPASREVPIIFRSKRGHQSKHAGGACRSELYRMSGFQWKPKPGRTKENA